LSHFKLGYYVRCIRQGGVIAYPTETIYGLGCDPHQESSVQHLLSIKQRPVEKGLIILVADVHQALAYVDIDRAQLTQVFNSALHPTTWLLPKSKHVPAWISGQHPSIAIRLTRHPIAAALCRQLGHPLVSTSANVSAHPPAKNPLQIRKQFRHQRVVCIHGPSLNNAPSEIKAWGSGHILRSAQ